MPDLHSHRLNRQPGDYAPNRYRNLTDEEHEWLESVFWLLRDHGFGFTTRCGNSEVGIEVQWHDTEIEPGQAAAVARCLLDHGITDFRVSYLIDVQPGDLLNHWCIIKVALDLSRYQDTRPKEPIRVREH